MGALVGVNHVMERRRSWGEGGGAVINGFSCFIGAMKDEVHENGADLSVLGGHGDIEATLKGIKVCRLTFLRYFFQRVVLDVLASMGIR